MSQLQKLTWQYFKTTRTTLRWTDPEVTYRQICGLHWYKVLFRTFSNNFQVADRYSQPRWNLELIHLHSSDNLGINSKQEIFLFLKWLSKVKYRKLQQKAIVYSRNLASWTIFLTYNVKNHHNGNACQI